MNLTNWRPKTFQRIPAITLMIITLTIILMNIKPYRLTKVNTTFQHSISIPLIEFAHGVVPPQPKPIPPPKACHQLIHLLLKRKHKEKTYFLSLRNFLMTKKKISLKYLFINVTY